MYQIIAHFNYQNFEQDPVTLINQVVNQWLYNGQVIGREMAVTYHQNAFQVRLSVPEQTSLLPENNSIEVNEALAQAAEYGVIFEYFELIGRDYQAEETSDNSAPHFQLLYTTHLDTCSPLYDGDHFRPIPLYRLKNQALSEQLLHWQEDWQACDKLQMNGTTLEQHALVQISEAESELAQQGRALCHQLEQQSGIPTYYYLYRLGQDLAAEQQRTCPICHGNWRLAEPLHDIFHFQCEKCRLISNWSWELC